MSIPTQSLAATCMTLAGVLAGCAGSAPEPIQPQTPQPKSAAPKRFLAVAKAPDGLSLTLELPTTEYVMGQTFALFLTAANTSDKAIAIQPDPGWPVKVEIWRRVGTQWADVRTYPGAALRTTDPWELAPGARRTFKMTLIVEPDWPTNDRLAVVGRLNGRPGLKVLQMITVAPGGRGR